MTPPWNTLSTSCHMITYPWFERLPILGHILVLARANAIIGVGSYTPMDVLNACMVYDFATMDDDSTVSLRDFIIHGRSNCVARRKNEWRSPICPSRRVIHSNHGPV